MNQIKQLLKIAPVLIGEVRGARAEFGKRHDKSDKNAPPMVFGMFKVNLELLGDGAPVMLTVFLGDKGDPETYSKQMDLRRGEVIAVAVGKLEMKEGVRKAVCNDGAIHRLSEAEVAALRDSSPKPPQK